MLLDSMAKCCTEFVLGEEELLWRLSVPSSIARFRLCSKICLLGWDMCS
jgi:hypothetical protein